MSTFIQLPNCSKTCISHIMQKNVNVERFKENMHLYAQMSIICKNMKDEFLYMYLKQYETIFY